MFFDKLHGEDSSKIGFTIGISVFGDEGDKGKVIEGILDASGKILEIDGANPDALVGKKWDDLIKLMTK